MQPESDRDKKAMDNCIKKQVDDMTLTPLHMDHHVKQAKELCNTEKHLGKKKDFHDKYAPEDFER